MPSLRSGSYVGKEGSIPKELEERLKAAGRVSPISEREGEFDRENPAPMAGSGCTRRSPHADPNGGSGAVVILRQMANHFALNRKTTSSAMLVARSAMVQVP